MRMGGRLIREAEIEQKTEMTEREWRGVVCCVVWCGLFRFRDGKEASQSEVISLSRRDLNSVAQLRASSAIV